MCHVFMLRVLVVQSFHTCQCANACQLSNSGSYTPYWACCHSKMIRITMPITEHLGGFEEVEFPNIGNLIFRLKEQF
jgi:hypothetical protein